MKVKKNTYTNICYEKADSYAKPQSRALLIRTGQTF